MCALVQSVLKIISSNHPSHQWRFLLFNLPGLVSFLVMMSLNSPSISQKLKNNKYWFHTNSPDLDTGCSRDALACSVYPISGSGLKDWTLSELGFLLVKGRAWKEDWPLSLRPLFGLLSPPSMFQWPEDIRWPSPVSVMQKDSLLGQEKCAELHRRECVPSDQSCSLRSHPLGLARAPSFLPGKTSPKGVKSYSYLFIRFGCNSLDLGIAFLIICLPHIEKVCV